MTALNCPGPPSPRRSTFPFIAKAANYTFQLQWAHPGEAPRRGARQLWHPGHGSSKPRSLSRGCTAQSRRAQRLALGPGCRSHGDRPLPETEARPTSPPTAVLARCLPTMHLAPGQVQPGKRALAPGLEEGTGEKGLSNAHSTYHPAFQNCRVRPWMARWLTPPPPQHKKLCAQLQSIQHYIPPPEGATQNSLLLIQLSGFWTRINVHRRDYGQVRQCFPCFKGRV